MIFWSHSWKVYLADHYLQKGVASYNVQDYQMVEAHLREAVENYPQHKWALFYLGISQFRLQKLVEAEETLRKVIRLDPNYLNGAGQFGMERGFVDFAERGGMERNLRNGAERWLMG